MVTGLSVGITENYQNVANNSTNVTVAVTITWNGGSYNATGNAAGTLKIDGTDYNFKATFNTAQKTSGSEVIYSKTLNIAHGTDGSKSLSCSASFATGTMVGTVTASATKNLTQIPRESTIGATDANIGATSVISINRKHAAYTHSVAYSFGNLSGYLADGSGRLSGSEVKLSAVSLSFPVPESFYTQIPNATSGRCTLTVKTYSGNTQIGAAKTCTFTVSTSESNCRPQVSGTVTDINEATKALTGNAGKLVQGMSTAYCVINAQAKNSATVKKKTIAGTVVTSNERSIAGVETNRFVFSATDSRGYTTTYEKTVEMVNYVRLTCNASAERTNPTDGNGVLWISGNYFNGSFGAQQNNLKLSYRIGNGEAVQLQPQISGNQYSVSVNLQEMDYQTAYNITVTVEDQLIHLSKTVTLSKGIPVFDWGENDFSFNVPVSVMGVPINAQITTLNELDRFCFDDLKLHIGYGVINQEGYISFNVGWIALQMKVADGNNVFIRSKYGNKSWSEWRKI